MAGPRIADQIDTKAHLSPIDLKARKGLSRRAIGASHRCASSHPHPALKSTKMNRSRACVPRRASASDVWYMCSQNMAASPTRWCRCRLRRRSSWGSRAPGTHGARSEHSVLLMGSYSTKYQLACGKCTATARLISWPNACIVAFPQQEMRCIPGRSFSLNTVRQYYCQLPPLPWCTVLKPTSNACQCERFRRCDAWSQGLAQRVCCASCLHFH